ncbi:2-oxoacid:acceptor oxidoreductase family protein [Deltaproteobacteria bacterium TL4]
MNEIELKTHPGVLANRKKGLIPLAQSIQAASQGKIGITYNGMRVGDLKVEKLTGIDSEEAQKLLSQMMKFPMRSGVYPLEKLMKLKKKGFATEKILEELYRSHLPFVAEDIVPSIESRLLKVFLLGSAGTGVVSAVQDMVNAFISAGYYGRAFPLFDPSKKGAPVSGYGMVSRDPILCHSPFESPDIILLFDQKMFPQLRQNLKKYNKDSSKEIAILINSPMTPKDFRRSADFNDPNPLYTLDASLLLAGKRMPPNYAMIGGMLGVLGEDAVDSVAFSKVVAQSLLAKFGPGNKVDANVEAFTKAIESVKGPEILLESRKALGKIKAAKVPKHQTAYCEDGNRAIARALGMVLNQFPSVVAAYPITPQTQVVEYLAQMIADGELSSEGVTPESEHGAGGAVLGAARDRVLAFTATCSQGFALMSELIHTMAGMRMGNVLISNVLRSLNAPLDVENDHSDLYKVGLDAGFLVFMTKDVQQAFDFHLMAYLVSLYAEYREISVPEGQDRLFEMLADRTVMLPALVASEGFEVSHAPEYYLAIEPNQVEALYNDPFFKYIKQFVNTPNRSIMGALQLSNARLDTDFQRHQAMELAHDIIEIVFEKFEKYSGRRYDFIHCYNAKASEIIFVVAGAANGTFEEVARQFAVVGINVGVVHPNVLRPFPKKEWAALLKGKKVFIYDRDDPFGAVGGRLYTEIAGVVNEYKLAESGTALYSRIYGLGGKTPSLSLARDEILKALKDQAGELQLSAEKQYVGVNL